jgi:hypothetical protein
MEEALGLKQPDEPVEDEAEKEFSEADLKRILRRKLVFERRARGDTVEEIVSFCQKNGYPVTERTIFRDLRSEEVCSLIDELVRVQFRDIAMLRGYALQKDPKNPDDRNWKPNFKAFSAAIAARGFMISCLKPKVEPKVNVEVNVANKTEHVLLAEYASVISEAATLNSNLSRVRVGEPVDSKSSSSSHGKERSDS